ncbi:DUF4349 domain-containing protein [Actinocorallia longicatena]|uniref:DUF4349 domain-containing protein n=2 Tax=Actinocorallia longicatena TaxID=111803 RepID=A0ABP6QE12_9ACTN
MRKVLCALATVALVAGCAADGDSKTDAGLPAMASAPQADKEMADAGAAKEPEPGEVKNVQVTQQSAPEQRIVAYTATLRVRADKVEDAAAKAKTFVLGAGGYVGSENTGGDPVTAMLTLKVPSAQYPAILNRLSTELGKKISLEQSAEDVTEQIADVDSRIKSAKSALDRLRTLLGQAKTIGEVLRVSGEIDTRQADLEALQARQKSLAQRTTFATVTLEIVPPPLAPVEPKKKDDRGGFLGGLENGWNAFTAFVDGTLTVVGALLPFAVLALLLAVPALWLRRRRRAVPPAPPIEPEREKEAV